jgi:uncharacterized membrane protein
MTAMMFGYGGWPVWAVALMGIGMLAFLGVLIWAGYALMANSTRGSHQQRRGGQGAHERRSGADAREVLDERLARGEIGATEYQKLRGLIAADDDQASAGVASGR